MLNNEMVSQYLPRFSEYHGHLVEQKLSCNTRIAYEHQVSQFLRWLESSGIDLPIDPIARDLAVAEYKTFQNSSQLLVPNFISTT